jgi:PAS domain S-box-containing protein
MNRETAIRPVRILHLEDNALDGDLVREFLVAEGLDAAIDRVWTREAFSAALDERYDLILADHRLPNFDGEAALVIAREKAPRIPFIFVSGTLGEEVAVEALKRGATDYVVKQRLERLAPVVRRALDERAERTARREVEEALRLSEDSFVTFANAAPMLCWMAETNGYIHWYNQRWYEFTGTAPDQMEGWGWEKVVDPAALPKVRAEWRQSLEAGTPWETSFPIRRRDGQYRRFLTRAAPVRDDAGKVLRWVGTNTDISVLEETQDALRQSEDRLRLATENAGIGTWDFDPLTGRLRWDALCKAKFGLGPDAEVSYADTFLAGIHPEDRDMADQAVQAALDPAGPGQYEIEYRTIGLEDGIERWIAAAGQAIFEQGRAIRFVGTVYEITDRKIALDAAEASQKALQAESRALEILNRLAGEIAAEHDTERLVQAVVDAGVELAGAEFGAFFYNVVDRHGESYMLYALSGVERAAFENYPMPRSTELFGPTFRGQQVIRLDDVLADPRYGQNAPHRGMPEGHLPVRSYLAAPVMLRSGEVAGGLFFGHREPSRFEERVEPLLEGLAAQAALGIENARLFAAARKLNETLESQVADRTAERDRIWQVSEDLLGVADAEGIWLSVSPSWTRVLGWEAEELVGRTSEWLEHPDDRMATRSEVARLAQGETTFHFENRFRAKNGEYHTLSWRAVPEDDRIYCVARDITEAVRQAGALAETEDRLRQAQKMETLGQLTGGVAHDFNNLLQIVMGNLDMLRRALPEEPPKWRRAAENAHVGAERAATLTQRLLAFSRRQPLAPKAVSPHRLIAGMDDLLHRTLGETIRFSTAIADGGWMIEVDANQLESAILNLAVNARDAMPGGGALTVGVDHIHAEAAIRGQSVVPPGDYVTIAVTDTGSGMTPQVIQRVFEPFFTTKEVGKGTGLGLSMVYGFVKQSNGHVHIESRLGEGTTVRIYLPRLDSSAHPPAQGEPAPAAGGRPGGTETVLVCEDDEGVRAFSVETLRELGYHVLEAADAASALDQLEGCSAVDLLFTDVVLPGGMMGSDLAAAARDRCPALRILFTTGYARDAIVHHGRLDEGVELLPKPFASDDLARRVRAMLDG